MTVADSLMGKNLSKFTNPSENNRRQFYFKASIKINGKNSTFNSSPDSYFKLV